MTARQEGYNDGVAGSGLRDRPDDSPVDALEYERGFLEGSKARRAERDSYVKQQMARIFDYMPDAEGRN